MKFQTGQRVRWKSVTNGEKWFKGEIVRALKDGFYLIDDGSGLTPRKVHANYLGLIPTPEGQRFV